MKHSTLLLLLLTVSACCHCPTREQAITSPPLYDFGAPLGLAKLPQQSDIATSPASIEFVLHPETR